MQIIITDIIKTNFAVTTDDGNSVFQIIDKNLSNDDNISIDFKGITLMTTAFLNAAIGQLYSNNKYSSDFLNKKLKLENVQEEDKVLFAMVVKRAKEYFANKENFEKNSNDAIYGND